MTSQLVKIATTGRDRLQCWQFDNDKSTWCHAVNWTVCIYHSSNVLSVICQILWSWLINCKKIEKEKCCVGSWPNNIVMIMTHVLWQNRVILFELLSNHLHLLILSQKLDADDWCTCDCNYYESSTIILIERSLDCKANARQYIISLSSCIASTSQWISRVTINSQV